MESPENLRRSKLKLGLFGATRSGKTVYLTTMYWLSKKGRLPKEISGLLPADRESAKYLGERYAMIEAGQWPAGNLDSQQVGLEISLGSRVITLATNDFRGGDFTTAFYSNDPTSKDRAERFVQELFQGCSAYLFLVDCGEIRTLQENQCQNDQQATVASQAGAIETALNILHRKSWGYRVFHHPVAVVFTKGDLHPECMADPDAFAKHHLPPTWNYLEQHTRSSHKFFVITSTGEISPAREGPPLPLRPSENFFEPILWCARRHARRLQILYGTLSAVAAIGLLVVWFAMFLYHGQRMSEISTSIRQAQDDQLLQYYVVAQSWQGWTLFSLTHPGSATELRKTIVTAAENRINESLKDRIDEAGDLRTVTDWQKSKKQIDPFNEHYPGTENATRLKKWMAFERQLLGQQLVQQLHAAAEAGNEGKFNDLLKEYSIVASADLDPEVKKATGILDAKIAANKVKQLWQTWLIEPQNADDIRAKCQEAEETFSSHPPQNKSREFVELMRKTYDQPEIKQNQQVTVSFHLESESGHKVQGWFKINDTDIAHNNTWHDPVPLPKGGNEIEGASVSIHLLSTKQVQIALVVGDWKWYPGGTWNSHSTTSAMTLEELAALQKQPIVLTTDRDEQFRLIFQIDDRLVVYCKAVTQLKELGDELFRSAK